MRPGILFAGAEISVIGRLQKGVCWRHKSRLPVLVEPTKFMNQAIYSRLFLDFHSAVFLSLAVADANCKYYAVLF